MAIKGMALAGAYSSLGRMWGEEQEGGGMNEQVSGEVRRNGEVCEWAEGLATMEICHGLLRNPFLLS